MTPNRFRMTTLVAVVAVVGAGILLNSCATTGETKKDEAPAAQAVPQAEEPGAARQEPGGGAAETRPQPAAQTTAATQKVAVQKTGIAAGQEKRTQAAANPKGPVERTLAEVFRSVDWNRIVPPVGAVLAMALIWAFAFWLARLPHRKRSRARLRVVRPTGEQARGLAVGEPAYRTG